MTIVPRGLLRLRLEQREQVARSLVLLRRSRVGLREILGQGLEFFGALERLGVPADRHRLIMGCLQARADNQLEGARRGFPKGVRI